MQSPALVFSVIAAVLVSGCTGNDATSMIKALPEVQQFLNAHPNADITAVFYDIKTVSMVIDDIVADCGKQMEIRDYWKIVVKENDSEITVWVDGKTNKPLCMIKKGAQTTTTPNATATAVNSGASPASAENNPVNGASKPAANPTITTTTLPQADETTSTTTTTLLQANNTITNSTNTTVVNTTTTTTLSNSTTTTTTLPQTNTTIPPAITLKANDNTTNVTSASGAIVEFRATVNKIADRTGYDVRIIKGGIQLLASVPWNASFVLLSAYDSAISTSTAAQITYYRADISNAEGTDILASSNAIFVTWLPNTTTTTTTLQPSTTTTTASTTTTTLSNTTATTTTTSSTTTTNIWQACSITQNGVCPLWCAAGSDADCCVNTGKQWIPGRGCYSSIGSGNCTSNSNCTVTQDGCCPSWCAAGSDSDCCANVGKQWIPGQGCY